MGKLEASGSVLPVSSNRLLFHAFSAALAYSLQLFLLLLNVQNSCIACEGFGTVGAFWFARTFCNPGTIASYLCLGSWTRVTVPLFASHDHTLPLFAFLEWLRFSMRRSDATCTWLLAGNLCKGGISLIILVTFRSKVRRLTSALRGLSRSGMNHASGFCSRC